MSTTPTTLTVLITHPSVVRGEARTTLYNNVVRMLDTLGPEWQHTITNMGDGTLLVRFKRASTLREVVDTILPAIPFN